MGLSGGGSELTRRGRDQRILRRRHPPSKPRCRRKVRDRLGHAAFEDQYPWSTRTSLGGLSFLSCPPCGRDPVGRIGIYASGWDLAQERRAPLRPIPQLTFQDGLPVVRPGSEPSSNLGPYA